MLRRFDEPRRLGGDLERREALADVEHDARLAREDRQREHADGAWPYPTPLVDGGGEPRARSSRAGADWRTPW